MFSFCSVSSLLLQFVYLINLFKETAFMVYLYAFFFFLITDLYFIISFFSRSGLICSPFSNIFTWKVRSLILKSFFKYKNLSYNKIFSKTCFNFHGLKYFFLIFCGFFFRNVLLNFQTFGNFVFLLFCNYFHMINNSENITIRTRFF